MKRLLDLPIQYGRRFVTYVVDEVSLGVYLFGFFLVVVLFGFAYFILSPCGQGIVSSGDQNTGITFLNSLYFSVVTVSSLGYGDFRPAGASKLLVCLEVLFGLAFMGTVVARITSRRLAYQVRRLFSSDAQKRLDEFSEKFSILNNELELGMKAFGDIYLTTPDSKNSGKSKSEILTKFRNTLITMQYTSSSLLNYFSAEVEQDKYFSIAPVESVQRVCEKANGAIFRLSQLILSLSPEARLEIFDDPSQNQISEISSAQKQVCEIVRIHSEDRKIIECFERLLVTCKGVMESYFTKTTFSQLENQPDLVLGREEVPKVKDQKGVSETHET